MSNASAKKRQFFISFNQADRNWATWIAWVLEELGYTVWFQDWDFRGNFIEHMNRAHAEADRTVAVLSERYFGSDFTFAEWSARFAQDPAAREDRLVPVKVGPFNDAGMISPIIYADLIGCDEAEAQTRLSERAKKATDQSYRSKPPRRPGFPGVAAKREIPSKPPFPRSAVHSKPIGTRASLRRHRVDHSVSLVTGDPSTDWAISQPSGTEGLAELRLHPPRPGNLPNTFYVDATLRMATACYDWEGRTVSIGVRDVFLAIRSASYQPAQKSMIGDRAEHPHFKPAPGGVEVIGPRDIHGCLGGDPLNEEHVTVIEAIGDADGPVTLTLNAGRRSFSVAIADDGKERPIRNSAVVNKDAILNALIYPGRDKDQQGRIVLARARMRRRKQT